MRAPVCWNGLTVGLRHARRAVLAHATLLLGRGRCVTCCALLEGCESLQRPSPFSVRIFLFCLALSPPVCGEEGVAGCRSVGSTSPPVAAAPTPSHFSRPFIFRLSWGRRRFESPLPGLVDEHSHRYHSPYSLVTDFSCPRLDVVVLPACFASPTGNNW